MKAGTRKRAIGGVLLLVAAWLAIFGDKTPPQQLQTISQSVSRPPSIKAAPSSARGGPTPQMLELSPRNALIRDGASAPVDVFSTRNWTPPPPPMAPVPVLAPTAPPLPYAYVGKKNEAGQWEVYLSRNDNVYIARQGSSVEGTYTVERIEPPTMTFKYQPLGQLQSLSIGE